MPKPGRPKSEGIPYPIKPYLTIEQSDWLDRQKNKSQAIANLIQQQIDDDRSYTDGNVNLNGY